MRLPLQYWASLLLLIIVVDLGCSARPLAQQPSRDSEKHSIRFVEGQTVSLTNLKETKIEHEKVLYPGDVVSVVSVNGDRLIVSRKGVLEVSVEEDQLLAIPEAIEYYRKQIKTGANHAEAEYALANLYVYLENYPAAQAFLNKRSSWMFRSRVIQGELYLLQGDYAEAVDSFTKALEDEPDAILPLLSRAGCNFNLEKYGEALRDCDRVESIDPDNPVAKNVRGCLMAKRKEFGSAIKAFNLAIQKIPNSSYIGNRAVSNGESGDYEEACNDAIESISKNLSQSELFTRFENWANQLIEDDNSNEFETSLLVGIAATKKSQWNTALEKLTTADKLRPSDALVDYFLGLTEWFRGNTRASLAKLECCVQNGGDWSEMFELKSRVHMALGQYHPALESAKTACQKDASNFDAFFLYGLLELRRGEATKADQIAEYLVSASPYRPEFHVLRGFSHLVDGHQEDAIKHLVKAVDVNPHCLSALLGISAMQAEKPSATSLANILVENDVLNFCTRSVYDICQSESYEAISSLRDKLTVDGFNALRPHTKIPIGVSDLPTDQLVNWFDEKLELIRATTDPVEYSKILLYASGFKQIRMPEKRYQKELVSAFQARIPGDYHKSISKNEAFAEATQFPISQLGFERKMVRKHLLSAIDCIEDLTTLTSISNVSKNRLILLRGKLRFAAKDYENAVNEFNSVLANQRFWHQARLFRGLANYQLGKTKEAYEEILAIQNKKMRLPEPNWRIEPNIRAAILAALNRASNLDWEASLTLSRLSVDTSPYVDRFDAYARKILREHEMRFDSDLRDAMAKKSEALAYVDAAMIGALRCYKNQPDRILLIVQMKSEILDF